MNNNTQKFFLKQWQAFLPWQKFLVACISLLLAAGMIKAVYYTNQFGGADLRERIVGARVLNTPHSPYYYKWQPGEPEELINPNQDQTRNISGLSVAPGSLYVLYLFSPLKYPVIRWAWLVFQYVLLLYLLIYFLREAKSKDANLLVAGVGVLFFCCSSFWLLHIDRGQIYILYAFFFCLIYQFYKSEKPLLHYLAGMVMAVGIYCRPNFAIVALPLLFSLNKRVLTGLLAGGIAAGIGLIWNIQLWKDYLSAMGAFTQLSATTHSGNVVQPVYPAIVEGLSNLQKGKIDFMCGGIRPLDVWLAKRGVWLPGKFYVALYVVIIAGIGFAGNKILRRHTSVVFALAGYLLYILAEYIMPAPRGAYNLVQWIFPVLLMLSTGKTTMVNNLIIIIGLCFMSGFPFYFPMFYDVGEILLVISVMSFIWRYNRLTASHSINFIKPNL